MSGWLISCASVEAISPSAVKRGHADELRLELLEAGLGLLAFGQVADEPGEVAHRPPERISPTASSIGKVEPSLRWPTTTRPIPMMRRSPVVEVALHVTVVLRPVGLRHQDLDVLPDHLVGPHSRTGARRRR